MHLFSRLRIIDRCLHDRIETELKVEADAVVKAMGFQYGDFLRWNGATSILDNLVSPVLYSAHLDHILRDYKSVEDETERNKQQSNRDS